MKFTLGAAGLASVLVVATATATPILIDDFSDGDVLHTANSSEGWVYSLTNATALGGNRGVQLVNYGLGTALAEVGGGRFGVSYPTNGFGGSLLVYGAIALIPGGAGTSHENNFDLSQYSALRLHFAGNDQPLEIRLEFIEVDADSNFRYARYSKMIAGGQFSPFTVDIDDSNLTEFSPLWDQFDMLFVGFVTQQHSVDFALTQIEAVPEPATLLALGGASALLLARRRRAKAQA